MADRFTSRSCSVKNKFSDWLIKQLLNSIITKYFNLSVSHMSINPQPLPSADWSNGHRQIMIFFLNLLSWLLRGSSCLTDLTQSTKVLLPLEANKICVSIAAKICRQVKPEFPLSPMDDNYMYPINRLLPLGNKGLEIFGKTWECNLPKIHPPELHVLLDLINCVCCWYSKLCPLFCFFFFVFFLRWWPMQKQIPVHCCLDVHLWVSNTVVSW